MTANARRWDEQSNLSSLTYTSNAALGAPQPHTQATTFAIVWFSLTRSMSLTAEALIDNDLPLEQRTPPRRTFQRTELG